MVTVEVQASPEDTSSGRFEVIGRLQADQPLQTLGGLLSLGELSNLRGQFLVLLLKLVKRVLRRRKVREHVTDRIEGSRHSRAHKAHRRGNRRHARAHGMNRSCLALTNIKREQQHRNQAENNQRAHTR